MTIKRREFTMKKVLTLALAAVLALSMFTLTACDSDNSGTERTTLIMGTSARFFPFEFIADYGQGVIGQYAGIDLSLVARIAYYMDVDIVVQDQEFVGLILALQNREIDFIAAGMTIRPDRQEQVNFTVPYFNAGQYVIVRTDSDINSIADLEGLLVGVQLATTGDFAITDGHEEGVVEFGNIARFNDPNPGIMDVLTGSLDAFVIDAPVARGFVANNPDGLRAFADPDGFFGPESFGMAFHKDDTELLAQFNEILERLIAEGYVEYLYNYYNTHHAQHAG